MRTTHQYINTSIHQYTITSIMLKKQLLPALVCLFLIIIYGCTVIKNNKVADDPSNFHLYLLAGQSNMSGRGIIDSVSKKINPQILVLDQSGKWVPATDPLHFDKPKVAGGRARFKLCHKDD